MSGPVETTVDRFSSVYDEAKGGYVSPESTHAVLYTWPDGFRVLRRLNQVDLHIVDLLLQDSKGEFVSHLSFDEAKDEYDLPQSISYPLGSPRRSMDGQDYVDRWVAFGVDMLMASDIDLRGQWGVLETPFWLKSSVFERLDNSTDEEEIRKLHGKAVRSMGARGGVALHKLLVEKVAAFIDHVFAEYEILKGEEYTYIQPSHPKPTPGLAGKVETSFIPRFHWGWELLDFQGRIFSSHSQKGGTLQDLLLSSPLPGYGPYRDQAGQDAWFDALPWGTPTVDLNLEPYALLDVYSPVLWPLSYFKIWWAEQDLRGHDSAIEVS